MLLRVVHGGILQTLNVVVVIPRAYTEVEDSILKEVKGILMADTLTK